jgi:hypothetical protein
VRGAVSFVVLSLAALLATGCSTTKIVESWEAPGLVASDLAFEHVIAIAEVRAIARQRVAEDALATAVTRTKVTPAHTLLSQEDRADVERLRQALIRNDIDGAITVRLVGIEDRQTYVPGSVRSYQGGYYGYYGRGTVIYDPGYVRTDTHVFVETSLYNVAAGKLLWAGVSESLNPSSVDNLIEGIVRSAAKELADQGLLP